MTEKIRKGESIQDYVNRILTDFHVISGITYQIDGVDTDPMYATFKPIDFKSRKLSIEFDVQLDTTTFYWNAAKLVDSKPEYHVETFSGTAITLDELNSKFINTDCRMKKMDTKLKRLLR